ncbi:hypothetical protein PSHT_08870, partial [Puccinia striiformis]
RREGFGKRLRSIEVISNDLAGGIHSVQPPALKFFVRIMRSQFVLTIFIASACCIVLTPKLEVEGSGPIALDGLVSSASSDEPKSTSINRDQSPEAQASFWPDAREEAEYPFRKEFTDLIKDSPFKDLHPKKRFLLLRSWERNSDVEGILNQQKWEELLLDNSAEDETQKGDRLSARTRDLCKKGLLQLGGLDSPKFQDRRTFGLLKSNHDQESQMAKYIEGYPLDMVTEIVEETWERLSFSILDDINRIIIDQKSLPKHQKPGQYTALVPAVSYQFKTMDFLYKQGFIKKEAVRRYVFHDKESVKNLITYVHSGFVEKKFISANEQEMWEGNESIINHWYFPLMHKMFEAFDEKDQQIIALYRMELKILKSSNFLEHSQHISKELKEKLASLSVEEYVDRLQTILNGSNKSIEFAEMGINRVKLGVNERNQMKIEIGKMIQLLHDLRSNHSSDDKTDLEQLLFYVSVCYFLDFTERNICKGIVEETEAETIVNGFLTSTADRKATQSSTTLGEYLHSAGDLLRLLNDEESQSYSEKNEAYLKKTIENHIKELSIKITEVKKWYEIAGNNCIIYGSLEPELYNWMISYTNEKMSTLKDCATRSWKA